jgi:acetyltransferase-like isoleucine patch superfamily enzyme
MGDNVRLCGALYLHGRGKYIIGNDVTILSGAAENPTVGDASTHFNARKGAQIIIGNRVGISNAAITAKECVTIEDDAAIGAGAVIMDTDFHPLSFEERMETPEHGACSPVTIKKGAFIGARAMILKGVTVGEHAVVGAGAVVTKSIPEGEIWAGNPACRIGTIHDKG